MQPIQKLRALGQSVWLDFIDHQLVTSGKLERLIADDGLAGLTSNPTLFQKSIAAEEGVDPILRDARPDETDAEIFERIQVRDVTLACDAFRALYEITLGAEGFVSIEVPPSLAHDTEGSIEAARRLWRAVSRPNLMIKIPATVEGLPAIEQCLFEGINVNVTLVFDVSRYLDVAARHLRALHRRVAEGASVDRIASVASFFISRVDAKVDPLLPDSAAALRGRSAIANATVAYEEYETLHASERWLELAAKGAHPQRLLWGSTSPKDPRYEDVYYVEALVAPETVDTMTLDTLRAYRQHGRPEARLPFARVSARELLESLADAGIDFAKVTRELEDEGVRAFAASFDRALECVAEKRREARRYLTSS